uniref:dolichyl-phosphate beta-glucosyltransferase n=1 Tax=Lepeophtheirus salmonis TaxID=72036 RepID=D3PG98_LEPSM|nr:Dolichyl-phosphate beta-glucosyltransferase [Lepeophtheirus salmonis]
MTAPKIKLRKSHFLEQKPWDLINSEFLPSKKNRGKGGAVRMGVLRARGRNILFVDADGATKFSDLEKLEASMKSEKGDLICGSRAHLETDSIAARSAFRTVLMKGFHFCVWLFGSKSVLDTQCGFKLMNRDCAIILFHNLHIERWAFDVELIKIAEAIGLNITEVAVNWEEIDGSKLDPVSASIQMLRDLFLLWLRYAFRLWVIQIRHKKDN